MEENHRVVVDDATVNVKENDTRKKLIESVSIQSTNNFNINQIYLNTDKFTNIILNKFSSRIEKNSRRNKRKWDLHHNTCHVILCF